MAHPKIDKKSAVLRTAAGVWFATLATSVLAQDQVSAPDPRPVLTLEGLRAWRDAETGAMRAPTAAELAARREARALRKEDEGKVHGPLQVQRGRDGTLSAFLGTRNLDALVATRLPDGRVVVRHASDLQRAPSAPTELEVR